MNPKLTDAQLLELIRHFSYDCCVVHDEAGIITFVSDSYQRITGHDPAQIIGEPISVLRELANVVERIVVLSPSDLITAEMLPESILRADTQGLEEAVDRSLPLGEFLEKMERFRIARAVEKEQTLRSAAEELGIDLSTLTRKLQKYNIPRRNQRKFVHTNLPKGHLAAAGEEGWE